jgi:hypothetical protein
VSSFKLEAGERSVESRNFRLQTLHFKLPTGRRRDWLHKQSQFRPRDQARGTVSGAPRRGAGLLNVGKYWRCGEYLGTMTRHYRTGTPVAQPGPQTRKNAFGSPIPSAGVEHRRGAAVPHVWEPHGCCGQRRKEEERLES